MYNIPSKKVEALKEVEKIQIIFEQIGEEDSREMGNYVDAEY
jgi:hypothetical protein